MGRIHLLLYLYMSSCLLAQQPQIQFQSVPDPLKLPADLYLGEAAGVAVNSNGHIFVLSRGNSTICTPGLMRTPSRSIRRTTSGWPTRARTWSSNLIPRAV